MEQIKITVVKLHSDNFDFMTSQSDQSSKPWLIDFFIDSDQSLSSMTRKKLASTLENLVNVAFMECSMEVDLCSKIGFDSSLVRE